MSGLPKPRSLDPEALRALRAYRFDRVQAELARADCAGLLLYDPINIRYALDSRNMSLWTMHTPARYAFIACGGPAVLFDFHGCAFLAAELELVREVRPAVPWYYFGAGARAPELLGRWASEVASLVAAHGGGNRRLALDRCEPGAVPALEARGLEVVGGQPLMERARLIKSPEEIAAMRVAIAACEAGMRAMREALRPGLTELELWAILHRENIARGGEWIETRLLASGPRTNPWFHEASERVMQAGELVSFDTDLIGPYGYCADLSRSWRVDGERPSDEQRRLYALAHQQIAQNASLIRPGVGFIELTEKAFSLPERYRARRYSVIAHGVGLCDEYPAIYYREDAEHYGYDGVIEENMTLCVESYVGAEGGGEGVKLESQVLVTADGAVPLSSYPFEEAFL